MERPGLTASNHLSKVSSFLAALCTRLTLARFALTDAALISFLAALRSADCFRWAARFARDSRISGMARQSNGWSGTLLEVALRSNDWSSQLVVVAVDLHDVGRVAVGSSACSGVGVLAVSSDADPGTDSWRVALGSSVVPSVSSDDDPEIS